MNGVATRRISLPARSRAVHFTWTRPRAVLATLLGVGLVAAAYRFVFGLGAATNLSDQWPWGFWIGFDVVSGVALAGGAFTLAAAVHLFRQHQLEPLLRPAILTGFLGYLLVIFGLLADLGKPWNIWHPIVMWQPHSVMFEVAWCVMLYTTVLALEFAPALFERLRANRVLAFLRRLTPALVVAGVVLSTLHQSSLGSLFLVVPGKLHPLWNSMMLPLFFFASAIVLGLGMVTLEATLSARSLTHRDESPVLARLLRALPWAVGLYLAMKLADLAVRGELGALFAGSLEAGLFWLELLLLAVPAGLALSRRIRSSARVQGWLGATVVAAVVLNRFNVSLFGIRGYAGAGYVPSLVELAISVGLISLGVLAFAFAAENLPVFHREAEAPVFEAEVLLERPKVAVGGR
ncbi:NrfD/PsrC family molybdoenzyme membrane anchor subunit [Limnochorda pilosa]|uniref:Hydrogenase n=1 Tax=Limnochorda pilosa TaxID=1555112 RepID=A0A0K2SJ55_LIMPI|nr:Ni/Fe-hydrogenase cytochrome b subunit [Limnochorda pilosa]BAS27062.1 hydrogenase [Limnochorda pilosa]